MARTAEQRFLEKVKQTGSDVCWEWSGGRDSKGYGRFRVNGQTVTAQRWAWRLAHDMEQLPSGVCVCHRCDNPGCVNPAHLFLGTRADNARDMHEKGRAADQVGENNGCHKLSEEDVLSIRRRYQGEGVSQAALAREYGVTRTGICDIVHHRLWRHI